MTQDAFPLFEKSYIAQVKELSANFDRIDPKAVEKAARLILNCSGKLVLSGMGKSGLIAQKLAATFASTGTPAFFLHPGESLHGDLGVLQKGDLLMVLAKSGESDEVIRMLQVVHKMEIPVIAILGEKKSSTGKMAEVIIEASIEREADPLNLAPTSSTTVSLVVGDALASMVSEMRGFRPENFALYHPAGQLGKRLLLNVEDLLATDREPPIVREESTIRELIEVEQKPNLGGVMVVDSKGKLIGIVTDGDMRRAIFKFNNVLDHHANEIMTKDPLHVKKGTRAYEAFMIMENRPSQISVLPVVDESMHPVGLLRLHDLLRAGL